jgi:hypothetical protein
MRLRVPVLAGLNVRPTIAGVMNRRECRRRNAWPVSFATAARPTKIGPNSLRPVSTWKRPVGPANSSAASSPDNSTPNRPPRECKPRGFSFALAAIGPAISAAYSSVELATFGQAAAALRRFYGSPAVFDGPTLGPDARRHSRGVSCDSSPNPAASVGRKSAVRRIAIFSVSTRVMGVRVRDKTCRQTLELRRCPDARHSAESGPPDGVVRRVGELNFPI